MSAAEDQLALQLRAAGIPFEREWRFHPARRWRFDFAFQYQIAAEIDGGAWTGGRHARGAGIEADAEKYSEAAVLGWRVMRFTPRHVKNGFALDCIARALGVRA